VTTAHYKIGQSDSNVNGKLIEKQRKRRLDHPNSWHVINVAMLLAVGAWVYFQISYTNALV